MKSYLIMAIIVTSLVPYYYKAKKEEAKIVFEESYMKFKKSCYLSLVYLEGNSLLMDHEKLIKLLMKEFSSRDSNLSYSLYYEQDKRYVYPIYISRVDIFLVYREGLLNEKISYEAKVN